MLLLPKDSPLPGFFVLGYLLVLLCLCAFFPHVGIEGWQAATFIGVATVVYAAVYLLPVVLLVAGIGKVLSYRGQPAAWATWLVHGIAVVGVFAVLLLIYTDYQIFELYEYHINGFVINLVTTPGGIASLGITSATTATATTRVAGIFLSVIVLFLLAGRLPGLQSVPERRWFRPLLWVLLLSFAGQEVAHAYCKRIGNESVMAAAQATPFRFDSSMSKVFRALKIEKGASSELRLSGGEPAYPAVPLDFSAQGAAPNIIVLVAESFRWDLLTPETTPNLWHFSERASRYAQHYSGGNRTRMGLFSLFYGIYAPYWNSFEKSRVAPVLMDVLRARNYQFALHTSQSFDYPELRHTTFAKVPEASMQELKEGAPWKRDQQNITDMIGKLRQRDPKRPFFGFMFFESTHAPYDFPPEDVVRKDYLAEMDYAKLNLGSNIKGIHARYINAAHHIDREVARLLGYLEKSGMLENTIVLFTGDHGEEFMEKGRWGHGHGSTFPEEQIHVPFILSMPGKAPAVIERRTSHLQFAPTVLKALGVKNPVRDYSSADSLDQSLPYFVLGEYDYMALMDNEFKVSYPYSGAGFFQYTVRNRQDDPVNRETAKSVIEERRPILHEIALESRRFVREEKQGKGK